MQLEYFQMIDRIEEVDLVGKSIVCSSIVPNQSPIFEGHFPGMPLMPGVLLIETMAQASGFLILSLADYQTMPFLVVVKEGKLRAFVEPGTPLQITAEIDHDGSGFAMTRASIKSASKKICDCRLTFKTMPFPDQKFADMMRKRGAELTAPAKNP